MIKTLSCSCYDSFLCLFFFLSKFAIPAVAQPAVRWEWVTTATTTTKTAATDASWAQAHPQPLLRPETDRKSTPGLDFRANPGASSEKSVHRSAAQEQTCTSSSGKRSMWSVNSENNKWLKMLCWPSKRSRTNASMRSRCSLSSSTIARARWPLATHHSTTSGACHSSLFLLLKRKLSQKFRKTACVPFAKEFD